MANTYVDYVGSDGTGTGANAGKEFLFSFPYIKTSHVVVEINQGPAGGVNKWERTTAFTVETSPSTRVVLDSVPNSLWRIRVLRDSDASTGLVDFANGSVLTETELDNSYEHNRYLAEEAEEGITGGSLSKNTDGQFDADGLRLENLADPDSDDDAVNKGYADNRYVDVAGDTMTGNLDMGANKVTSSTAPSNGNDLTNKTYVDDTFVDAAGDTMTGQLNMGSNKITNLGTPTDNGDAANKSYVDQTIDNAIALGGSPAIVSLGGYDVTALGTTRARSLADRFADVVNVKDFGNWGGTASQNRTALASALAYVETGAGQNKTVYIPEGEYEIDQAVSIVSSSIVKGAGSGSTILKLTDDYGAGNKLFNILGRSNIRIQDIQFDGNRAGQTDFEPDPSQPGYDNGNICLYIVGANNVTVDNCYFKNWSKDAVTIDATTSYPTRPYKININNCKFDTIYRNGITVIEGEDLSFTKNYFFGGSSLDKATEVVLNNGIRIEPDSNGENTIDCVVSNNQFKDLHGGFNVYGEAVTSGTVFRNIVVSDNLFNNIVSEAGVVLYKTDLITASSTDEDGFIISGNKFYNCGPSSANASVAYGGGVSVNRCNNVIITNNFFNQCEGNEATVGVNQAGLNTSISNNTFELDQKRAIIIASPVDTTRTSLNITNNICSRGSQSSLGTYAAISASGNASASGAYFISNNTIQTSTSNSYGIGIQTGFDDGTSIIAKNQIRGNGVDYEHLGGTRFENLFEIYEETVTTTGALSASLTYDITRTDNVVTLELGSLTGTTTATSSIGITTTLPERFRPSTVLFGFCNIIVNNVSDSQPGIVEVRDNGTIQVSRGGGANFTTDPNSGFSGVTFTYSI